MIDNRSNSLSMFICRLKRKWKHFFVFTIVLFAAYTLFVTFNHSDIDLDEIIEEFHKIPRNKDCKVIIIEEHHEVIPFWMKHASPKDKIFLAHYDGHSDFAMPHYLEEFPIVEDPRTIEELISVMPSNDQFIVSFALTNRLSKAMVFFPPWTPEAVEPFDWTPLTVGSIKPEALPKYEALTREVFEMEEDEPIKRINCICRDYDCDITVNETKVPYEDCKTRLKIPTSFIVLPEEEIPDNDYSGEGLILDIDQDFFGVQLPVSELPTDLQNRSYELQHARNLVSSIFCFDRDSTQGDPEIYVKNWFVKQYLERIEKCKSAGDCDQARKMISRDLFNHEPPLTCRPEDDFNKRAMKTLFEWFVKFTQPELDAFKKIGICYQEPLLSLAGAHSDSRMDLCLGRNLRLPNPTVIEFLTHVTSDEEEKTENELFDIFEHDLQQRFGHVTPRVITIARSSRDGYTPRQRQQHIESNVLKVLKRVYPSIKDDNICYSHSLLGGRDGWLRE